MFRRLTLLLKTTITQQMKPEPEEDMDNIETIRKIVKK